MKIMGHLIRRLRAAENEGPSHLRTSEPTRRQPRQPSFARFYARVSPSMKRVGAAEYRHALLTGLTGRVIDVGSANGLDFERSLTTLLEALQDERS